MSTTRSPHPKGTDMTTMLKLTTLGALLACAGAMGAANAKPTASPDYPPGPVRINPQPLPPGCPGCIRSHDGTGSLGALSYTRSTAEGSPLRLAGGDPPTVVDSCHSRTCRS